MQLFLGAPIEGAFASVFNCANPDLLLTFVKNDSDYLSTIVYGPKTYLGKSLGVIYELAQLELSEAHLRSLVKKLFPDFPSESLTLYLIPIPDAA